MPRTTGQYRHSMDGNLSFDWIYNGADPLFGFLLIDLNGVISVDPWTNGRLPALWPRGLSNRYLLVVPGRTLLKRWLGTMVFTVNDDLLPIGTNVQHGDDQQLHLLHRWRR